MTGGETKADSSGRHPVFRHFAPCPPPYDPLEWRSLPWPERLRLACLGWVLDGYGAPPVMYALYVLKVLLFVVAWVGFCTFDAHGGVSLTSWGWVVHADAFKKAILWSMAFEGLGLGCGSGPLTGRYMPPVAAPWHFARPGTVKLPLLPNLPILGGSRRTALDALLYVSHITWLFVVLCSPEVTPALLVPSVVLLGCLGLADKTILLASRSEHYLAMTVCFLFADEWVAGSMVVALGIWLWAAVSKLTAHFPDVVSVMTCNSPCVRSRRVRRAMVRDFPQDLRPSRLTHVLAGFGALLEFAIPLLLLAGEGGAVTIVGLAVMVLFHVFITSNFPMAVPLEWNVVVVYGGFFLFGHHAEVALSSLTSWGLIAFLVVSVGVVPLVGNLAPSKVSFLLSMRYYAGNWPFSVWLFRGDAAEKLDQHLLKAAQLPHKQLAHFFDERTSVGALSKVPAFRAMHLHGRALHELLPKAVEDIEEYNALDGEIVAGLVLGYNFGDGHLHGERLLRAVQERCGFAPGELRHVCVEAQPLGGASHRWQIHDAAEGLLCEGEISVKALLEQQPWPSLKAS
jgi:hypothetical protein